MPKVAQFAQIAGRMTQRLDRIERIGKTAPAGGARHELRDALGALGAYGQRIEAALLPDDAGEEFDRQTIFRRRLLDGAADVFRRWRFGAGSSGLWPQVGFAQAAACAGLCVRGRTAERQHENKRGPANRIMRT